jgi:hypothetical protein
MHDEVPMRILSRIAILNTGIVSRTTLGKTLPRKKMNGTVRQEEHAAGDEDGLQHPGGDPAGRRMTGIRQDDARVGPGTATAVPA